MLKPASRYPRPSAVLTVNTSLVRNHAVQTRLSPGALLHAFTAPSRERGLALSAMKSILTGLLQRAKAAASSAVQLTDGPAPASSVTRSTLAWRTQRFGW